MQPEFYRIGDAINQTMAFYKIGKIKDHMQLFAKPDTAYKYVMDWYELVFDLQNRMEAEILQTIYTCDHNTHVYLFETLKGWLSDDRVSDVSVLRVVYEIESYNNMILDEFEIKVEEEVKKHREKPEFIKYKHLEKYQTENRDETFPLFFRTWGDKIRTVTNYEYYCINEKPDLIDTAYIPDYINLLDKLISNFRNILTKYIKMYDEDKIKAHNVIVIERPGIISAEKQQPLLDLPLPSTKKMKVNLSVPQLAYLFHILNELSPNIFEFKTKTELYKFVSDSFVTKATKETGISVDSFRNSFTDPDKTVVEFWIEHFKKMLELSRKKFS